MSPTNEEQARLVQSHQAIDMFAASINRGLEQHPGEDSRKLLLDVAVCYIFALKRYNLADFSDAESVLERCGFDNETSILWGTFFCSYANQEGQ